MHKRKSPWLRNWLILVVILAGIYFGPKSYWDFLQSPVNPSQTQNQNFSIQKGETTSSIADSLEQQGLIRSALMFKIKLKLDGEAGTIQAGDYQLSPSMDLGKIISSMQVGAEDVRLTLLEGWRVEEMAKKINDALGIKDDQFLKYAKEGYMFPDTYQFNKDVTVQNVAQNLKDNFNQKYSDNLKQKISQHGLTADQGVILASIVEREARSDQARTMVASILLKRLNIGMALDADSTVQYAKDNQKLKQGIKLNKFWEPITTDDYQTVLSDYNTYLNPGLPPGPICNPSLSSLTAVADANLNSFAK